MATKEARVRAKVVAMGPRFEQVTVTPEMAAEWLARNVNNRPLSQRVVGRYVRDMKEGRWELNGETVKFNRKGDLLDGQHRLAACIQAEVSFETLVVYGLPEESFATVDTGQMRGGKHVLAIEGEKNAALLAATLGHVYRWERGYLDHQGHRNPEANPTNQDLLDTLERHPDVRRSVEVGQRAAVARSFTPSVAACLHYAFSQKDPLLADAFMEGLETGADLPSDSPILVLRERLFREAQGVKVLPNRMGMAFAIKAWNAFRSGRTIERLIWVPGKEPFPTIE